MSISSTHAVGHSRRLARLFGSDARTLIVGFDHAVSTGTAGGTLAAIPALARQSWRGGTDALQIGLQSVRELDAEVASAPEVGLVLRIDQSSVSDESQQVVPVSVRWASPRQVSQAAGDAAVVFYVHDLRDSRIGSAHAQMVGAVADECSELGLPLLVEVMVKSDDVRPERISSAMVDASRIAFELGADLVKVDCTPAPEAMRDLVDAVPVPVLLRGGSPCSTLAQTRSVLEKCLDAGVAGAVYGRTIWQSPDPEYVTRELQAVIHGRATAGPAAHRSQNEPSHA